MSGLSPAASPPIMIFDMVRKIRRKSSIPMVFMTYANVVFSYGTDRFIRRPPKKSVWTA